MWIVQNDVLVRMADEAPIPRGSRRVDVPDDFEADPGAYTLRDGEVVPVSADDEGPRRPEGDVLKLTQDEIRILKDAIASGQFDRRKTSR